MWINWTCSRGAVVWPETHADMLCETLHLSSCGGSRYKASCLITLCLCFLHCSYQLCLCLHRSCKLNKLQTGAIDIFIVILASAGSHAYIGCFGVAWQTNIGVILIHCLAFTRFLGRTKWNEGWLISQDIRRNAQARLIYYFNIPLWSISLQKSLKSEVNIRRAIPNFIWPKIAMRTFHISKIRIFSFEIIQKS